MAQWAFLRALPVQQSTIYSNNSSTAVVLYVVLLIQYYNCTVQEYCCTVSYGTWYVPGIQVMNYEMLRSILYSSTSSNGSNHPHGPAGLELLVSESIPCPLYGKAHGVTRHTSHTWAARWS